MLLEGQSNDDTNDTADVEELRAAAEGAGKEPAEPAIPPAPEPNKPVALVAPKSRRAQAEEERKAELSRMSQTIDDLRKRDEARDRQFGELTGHLSVLAQQRQAAPVQQQAPAPQLPDPEELLAKANAALDGRDMQSYHRYLMQANQAATMRQMAPVMERMQSFQQQAPQQAQIPPALMPYFAAYPQVASHPAAMQLLAAKNVELGARGFREGPERVKAIFDEVQAVITAGNGQQRQAPGFDRGSAAALSGTPTARPGSGSGGGGKGEPRVDLTPEERFYWKKAGFTDENELAQNIAKSRPDRVVR